MAKRIFQKPIKETPELIEFLKGKGLIINDTDYAAHCIKRIGFYRLKIYTRAFENSDKKFKNEIKFEDIIEAYNFDRNLRLHALDAIERIEVSLRSHITNIMGRHGGPHFCYDEDYFESEKPVIEIKNHCDSSQHLSIKHYRDEYYSPYYPPIWCATESSTFGDLSIWFANLKKKYRKEIAKEYNLPESVCVSWFRSTAYLRNICAHHTRLWNADLRINQPAHLHKYKQEFKTKRVYSRLVVLQEFLRNVEPDGFNGWAPGLKRLINERRPEKVSLFAMGFPEDWDTREIWN